MAVKSKTAINHKAAVKLKKQIRSKQSDLSHLAEDIISNISVGMYIVQYGKFVYVSPLFQELSGYSYAELAGTNPLDYLHLDDREVIRKIAIKSLKEKSTASYEYRFIRKNSEVMWVLERISSIAYKGKRAALGSFMDITEHKQAEGALRQSEEKYRTIIETIQDGYLEIDLSGNYTFVNDIVCQHLGYSKEEIIGMNNRQFQDESNAKKTYQIYKEVYATGKPVKALENEVIRKDKTKGFYEASISLMKDSEGKPIGFRCISRDITERKLLQLKIEEMATHDYLTGLPNRVLLTDRFAIAAALAHRNKFGLAVMSLDLDKFKVINDTLGHNAGDQVLKIISTRLTGIIRASDTIARIGGDEFILVMLETNQREDATVIAQKIMDAFIEPLSIDGHQLNLSTSIGIAIYPEDAEDMETLIKKSDAAMYYAKGHGRNKFKFFGDGDVQIGGNHKSATLI
jgi:diguanylate cyclase (GGDEF)-like protein/PAS domain S-box-containing protein